MKKVKHISDMDNIMYEVIQKYDLRMYGASHVMLVVEFKGA